MSAETDDILAKFTYLLTGPTGDGKNKRDAGTKAHWTVDATHYDAMLRHLGRYWNGEREDADSGCHPLIHLAWRALALAWQETSPRLREIPGQAQFWKDVQDGALTPISQVPRQGGFINHDQRPLPRTVDRAPCATKLGLTEPFDEARAHVESAWLGEPSAAWPDDEGGLKGHHPC